MDAQSSQGSPEVEPPRNLFFGVEDRRLGGRAGLDEKYLTMERSRRHQLAEHVIFSANQLANAVRTLRAFDRTGDGVAALAHIEHTFEDLRKHTTNLVNEVNASVDRHGDGLDLLSFRDTALAAIGEPEQPAEAPVERDAPRVTPLTLVRSATQAAIITDLDKKQRNRAGASK